MNANLESSIVDLLRKIGDLKSEIDKFHPLPKEVEDKIFQKYRLEWNYNSNAIEGNTLNYGETYAFLMHGITASGKPLKDYLDIRGHNEAINYLINLVRNKEELTEAVIRELHKVILVESYETDALTQNGRLTKKTVTLGAYKTQPNHVKTATGEIHYFASPQETPAKMFDLMKWFRESKENKEIHPVILAAIFHHRFAEIHPFDDGNGRLARLLMNLILMQNNFPPAIISNKDRNNYYLALSLADAGDTKKLVEYVAEVLIHSMEIYLKGARGESIDEPDDLDKEIALLKKQIDSRQDIFHKYNSLKIQEETIISSYNPLLKEVDKMIKKFENMFINKNYKYVFHFENESVSKLIETTELKIDFKKVNISNDKRINDVVFIIELNKFKAVNLFFNLILWVKIRFLDYNFYISIKVNDKEIFILDDEKEIAKWFKNITYDKQISNEEIIEASKTISNAILDFIKSQIGD